MDKKKKKAQKKGAKIKNKPKIFADVRQEFCFNLADGRQLRNLVELSAALEDMDEATFSHHVNEARNDFANWVKDTMNEAELADKFIAKYTKAEHQIELLKHLIKRLL